MSVKSKAIGWNFLFLLSLCSLAFGQAQTGSIRGYINDDSGNALPGVNVTISSPSMMGKQSFLTTDRGEFRFPSCPPGVYVVKAEIQGFQTTERTDIIVHVGVTVDVTLALKPSAQMVEVNVTAASPVVDFKSSKTTFSITKDMIGKMPVNRDVYDLVRTAPGVVEEGGGQDFRRMISIHGGTVQQSTYAMDGVNINDPTRGYITMSVAFEAIEEIEMITGGISAEVGQTGGGYMNVVSKSGGNNLSGSATVAYNSEATSQSTIPAEQVSALGLPNVVFNKLDADATLALGGPIIKDKLWFFLSPRIAKQTQATPFAPFTDPTGVFHDKYTATRDMWSLFGKLSAQITNRLKLTGLWQYMQQNEDPAWDQLPARGAFGTYETINTRLNHAHTVSSVLTYIFDQNTFAELRGGFVHLWLDYFSPLDKLNPPPVPITDRASSQRWGQSGNNEFSRRYKWNVTLNGTKFLDNFLGAGHEFKAGVEYGGWYTKADYGVNQTFSIGYFKGTPWYYNDTQPYVGRITITNMDPRGMSIRRDRNWSIRSFIQDNVSIGKRLTLNLGLRYDSEHATRPEEIRKGYVDPNFNGLSNVLLPDFFATYDIIAPELKNFMVMNTLQPRIGLSYDLFGNGKTAFKASFARYGEPMLAANYGNVHFISQSVSFLWYDLNKNGNPDLPPTDNYSPVSVPLLILDPAKLTATIDPKLKAPYVDEFIVGVQQELMKDFSLTARFIYKENKNLVELKDLNNPIGGDMWRPYTTKDPGDDQKMGTGDDHDITVYALNKTAASPLPYLTNIDALKRKYWGTELVLAKRFSNNWQFNGSVIYSKQYGNIGFGVYDSQGTRGYYLDPNLLINRYGRQNWDRPLQIKLQGTVILPYEIGLSGYFRYASGAPMSEGGAGGGQTPFNRTLTIYFPKTVNGFAVKSPSVTVWAEPPGTKRNSPQCYLDLRVEKEFKMPFGGNLRLAADVFNALANSRLNISQDRGGYVYADGTFSRWPTFGRVLTAEGIRILKLTIRYTF